MEKIFEHQPVVRPSQLVAVAERRFDDAVALAITGRNAHANGAMYLAGFVIEILLKAQLMRAYPAVVAGRTPGAGNSGRDIWSLVWRSHDLGDMLDRLPAFEAALVKAGQRDSVSYREMLRGICGQWTIFARYSTRTATIADARRMIDRVWVLKEVLK